jgi:hypothetical protein
MSAPFDNSGSKPSLFITADYELFLGSRSGTIGNCLLEPTRRLADLVERYQRRLVIFVDNFFLNRLRQDAALDPTLAAMQEQIRQQLRELVGRGHHLGVHTHPQWLAARREGQEWVYSPDAPYRLQDLAEGDSSDAWKTIQGALELGKKELEALAGEAVPGYEVKCFRAGGLCLQPFPALSRALAANRLYVDSSVAPGCYLNDGNRHYDYRITPQGDFWRFEKDPLTEDSGGRFAEMPISTFRATFASRIRARLLRFFASRAHCKTWGDGQGRPIPHSFVLKRLWSRRTTVLSYDYWDARTIVNAMRKSRRNGHRRVVLLGHPKYLSPFGLRQLEQVLKLAPNEGWA